MDSAYLSSPLIPADILGGGSYFNPLRLVVNGRVHSYHLQTTSVNPVDLIHSLTFMHAELEFR
jgi:hypothetical protein